MTQMRKSHKKKQTENKHGCISLLQTKVSQCPGEFWDALAPKKFFDAEEGQLVLYLICLVIQARRINQVFPLLLSLFLQIKILILSEFIRH